MKAILTLVFAFHVALAGLGQDCSIYNKTLSPSNTPGLAFTDGDSSQHLNGEHFDTGSFSGSCSYAGSNSGQPCSNTCQTNVVYTIADTGIVPLWYHNIQRAIVVAVVTAPNGGQISCGAEFIAAVRSCLSSQCSLTVGINGSVSGYGGTVNVSNTPLWESPRHTYSNQCAAETAPVCQPTRQPRPTAVVARGHGHGIRAHARGCGCRLTIRLLS